MVGVGDGLAVASASSPAGHLDGVGDELGAEVIGDRPAHHPSGPGVDDHRQVDLAVGGGVFGDVHAPQPIRALVIEGAVDQVGVGVAARGGAAPAGVAGRVVDSLRFPLRPVPEAWLFRSATSSWYTVVDGRRGAVYGTVVW